MIRTARPEDIDAIAAIYDRIHDNEGAGELSTGWKRDIYPTKKTAEDALERHDLFVSERDKKIVAAFILNQEQVDVYEKGNWKHQAPEDKIMVLHTLTVDPENSGKGIGASIIRFYEDYAKQYACTELRLDTNETNSEARGFYKSLGYEEVGIQQCVFNGIEGINLVLLEKNISEND